MMSVRTGGPIFFLPPVNRFSAFYRACSLCAALVVVSAASAAPTEPPPRKSFGRLPDGRETHVYTLRNASGFQAEIADYGGTVVRLLAPDRQGQLADVVLGFDSVAPYPKQSPYFGAVIGRVGNRIAHGKFTLDGKTYALPTNNSPGDVPCTLHGGLVGFDKVL